MVCADPFRKGSFDQQCNQVAHTILRIVHGGGDQCKNAVADPQAILGDGEQDWQVGVDEGKNGGCRWMKSNPQVIQMVSRFHGF